MNAQAKHRRVIGVLAAAFLLFLGYYGTYLPMHKSQIFISATRSSRQAESLEQLEAILEGPLRAPSPVGQEELVRNAANAFQEILNRSDDPEVISRVMDFVEHYYEPIMARGRGMSFGQNLYVLGAMNEVAFIKTKQSRYLDGAEKYFSMGLELGPRRPQPLYGMFDIYRIKGNVEKSREIASQILEQWPEDRRVNEGLNEFLEKVGALNPEQ